MVSRGGRSKGCSTCRRRRVKCDEARPICNRCKKRGLECDGPKDSTWINENRSFPFPPEESRMIGVGVPASVSFAGFQDDICMAYTRRTLLRGGPVELAYNRVQSHPGLVPDPGLGLLREAILSLAVTFFGNQHRQNNIIDRGYRLYGSVLQQLNSHLAQSHLQTTDETILTALMCMLLEIFLPTAPDNFLKHARGIEAILEMRGPPETPTKDTAVIFHGLRLLSIVSGLADSKPSIYSRDEWKKIPSLHQDEAGMLRHETFSILAECTRLLSLRDIVLSIGPRSESQAMLLRDVKATLENLESIYPRWQNFNKGQFNESTSGLGKETEVANHVSATVSMLWNTSYMCLLDLLDSLEPSSSYASLRNATALKFVQCIEIREWAKRDGTGELNTIGLVATKVAWQSLGGFNSPEGRRLASAVRSAVDEVFAVRAWSNISKERPWHHPELTEKPPWDNWTHPMKGFEQTSYQTPPNGHRNNESRISFSPYSQQFNPHFHDVF